MNSEIIISHLETVPEFAGNVSNWIKGEWGLLPIHKNFDSICANNKWYLNFPRTLVAIIGNEPVGSVSVLLDDLETHPEYNPWIGCLYVVQKYRNKGIGTMLMIEAEKLAQYELGMDFCYLFTENQEKLYAKLGWLKVATDIYKEKEITIMKKDFPSVSDEMELLKQLESEGLLLELFLRAPVSMWACDDKYKVVLWNPAAEMIYGYTHSEVFGKNYLDLFVDDVEREQSKKDCNRVLQSGLVQRNCLANDVSKDGELRKMLTNVFRITSRQTGKAYQAEIGVETSDYGSQIEKLIRIREAEIEKKAKANLTVSKDLLVQSVDNIMLEVELAHRRNSIDIDSWAVKDRGASSNMIKSKRDTLKQLFTEDKKALQKLKDEIESIKSREEFDRVKEAVHEIPGLLKLLNKRP